MVAQVAMVAQVVRAGTAGAVVAGPADRAAIDRVAEAGVEEGDSLSSSRSGPVQPKLGNPLDNPER